MCDDNGKPFVATLHNILSAPDLCDRLFSIIKLMNSGNTCLFNQFFLHSVLRSKGEKYINITTQCTKETCISRKNHGKVKENKLPASKKIALELLHQRLGHRYTRSLLSGDTDNV